MSAGPLHQRRELFWRHHKQAVLLGSRIQARIWIVAVGGAGVQRSIGNDLERTHGHQTVRAGEHVAGTQPAFDGLVQMFGVDTAHDSHLLAAGGRSPGPGVDIRGSFEVDDPDDAAGRNRLDGRTHPFVHQVRWCLLHPLQDRQQLELPEQAGGMVGLPDQCQRRGVQPATVQVVAE